MASTGALSQAILSRMDSGSSFSVWTASDFVDLGARDAIDQALHRLTRRGTIRRVERGLYDKPRVNSLTKKKSPPDPRAVIEAIARRDKARLLVDGITAANDLGLSDAVPAKMVVHTDVRRADLQLGNHVIEFKTTAPSKLYWAGRPAMRVVQALNWLQDMLPQDRARIEKRLYAVLTDPAHGPSIVEDLREGWSALPAWMQNFLRDPLDRATGHEEEQDDDHDDDHRPPDGRRPARRPSVADRT